MSSPNSTRRLYKRLLSYILPYKVAFLMSIAGFVAFATAAPALAHLMGMVEETLKNPLPENIQLLVFLLVGVFFYRGLATFLGKYFTAVVGRGVVHSLRIDLFNKMLRLPARYYDNQSSGRLISRVIYDVDQVSSASTDALTTLVQEGVTVILLMAYLVYLDYKLTLIFLILIPVIALVVGLASRFFRRYSTRIQQSMGDVTQVTSESINGFREVRTYGGREYEEQRFEEASSYNRKQGLKFELTDAINVPLNQQLVAMGLAVMVYLMFQRVSENSMSSSEFLQFLTAAALIAKPLRSLTDVNSIVQRGIAAAESIFSVLDEEQEKDTGDRQLAKAKGQLSFEHLSFRYEGAATDALNNIQLDIQPGTSVAFVGRSGSGKSTLVNLIPRFYDATEGQIFLDDIPINDLTLDSLRKQIATVNQNVTLFNGTIRENIAYGALRHCTEEEIIAAAKSAYAHEFIEGLGEGYNTQVGENGILLSGGQKQRLAIARALLKDAPILILDEATSALDTESERYIQAAMEEVMKGRTTLVIAHRLSTIEKVDRIIVIDNGQILEDGNHDSLLAQGGVYAQLHQLQFVEQGA